ncbi:MAG TPA: hypothetical protein VFE12_09720 [Acetobacteraceae bacterium]|nr:hypothetical protein [Acetobacteraceae bacterium]
MDALLPGMAALLSLALAASMLQRFVRRQRPHELIWSATFAAFGVAAGVELYGQLFRWTPTLARLYYLAGASLSVGFLAAGTLFLLVPRPIAMVALIVVLVQSAFMVFLVSRAPIDPAVIQVAGWSALEKDAALRALALTINVLGSIVVIGGTFGSAYALWVDGRGFRASGVALIGLGTLVVAMGGSLVQYGHHWLYGPMVVGLLLIFIGYRRANAAPRTPAITEADRTPREPAVRT